MRLFEGDFGDWFVTAIHSYGRDNLATDAGCGIRTIDNCIANKRPANTVIGHRILWCLIMNMAAAKEKRGGGAEDDELARQVHYAKQAKVGYEAEFSKQRVRRERLKNDQAEGKLIDRDLVKMDDIARCRLLQQRHSILIRSVESVLPPEFRKPVIDVLDTEYDTTSKLMVDEAMVKHPDADIDA